jgi:autotransporter-associated beta strand protein
MRAGAQIPSFPGALGYGAATTGAWSLTGTNHTGGNVYHVTNLNDSGAGSFRTGVGTSHNIVVFDVGGDIQNLSPVSVASNVSIEGQTAPGGIQVFGSETSFYGSTNDICRYIRFRDGTEDPNYPGSSATDSHTNALNMGDTTNMILDHCCFEFAAYNNIDSAGAVNVTIQDCLFADPIAEQRFNCHFETGPVTMIDNLWANSHGRNPLGKGNMQYVNNVVYNYQYAMTTGNSSGHFLWDVVNNYFIAGPSTTSAGDCYYQVDSNQSAYAIGNYLDSNKDGSLNGSSDNSVNAATVLTTYWSTTTAALPTVTAAAAYYDVLSNAGPLPRDQVDSLVLSDCLSLGTQGMLWGNQTSTGLGNDGYGVITGGTPLPDSDASGMPDDWKAAVGISMTNPAAGAVTSPTGYTYLENYLAWKAQPNAWVTKNTGTPTPSVTIDLSQYSGGFGTGATYAVSNPVKGTATQSGTAPYLVTFVPTISTSGLGGFSWTVGNSTTTMTGTCGVLISQSGPAQSVRWTGGVSNSWDSSTANWTALTGGTATAFSASDPVTFDDTAAVPTTVNLVSAVSPGTMTVNTYANSFTLSGTGSIGGTGSLVKTGSTALTISNSGGNTFSGGTEIDAGTVWITNGSALGSGTTTLNGGDLEVNASVSFGEPIAVNEASTLGLDSKNGNISISGAFTGNAPLAFNFNATGIVCTPQGSWVGYTGSLTITGGCNLRLDNTAAWGFPNAEVNLNGAIYTYNNYGGASTIPFGQLTAGPTTTLAGSSSGGAAGTLGIFTIGSLNLPNTIAGIVENSGQIVGLTFTGNSTTTLSGSGTYTGPTSVTAGTLLLTGSLGATTLTISSGASFVSSSIVSGTLAMNQGSSLYIGNSTASSGVGTLTVGSGVALAGGTGLALNYGLSSSPTATGSNDQLTVTSGPVTLSGNLNFNITLNNGVLGAGTYYLINGNGTQNGSPSLLLNMGLPSGAVTRQTIGLGRPPAGTTPAFVSLGVTGTAGSLVWSGTSGATWDLNTTSDWSGASPATFYDLDSVTFGDASGGGTVTLSGTLAPNVIYVTATSSNYTFSGAGMLAGNTELVKSGSGALTIANTGNNSFTGPIYLNAGILYANNYLGSGTIYLNGGTLYVDNGTYLGNPIVVETTSTIYAVNGSDWVANNAGATLSSTGPVTLYIGVSNGTAFTVEGNMDQFQGTFEIGASAGLIRLNGDGSSQALFDIGTSTATLANRNGNITAYFGGLAGGPNTTLEGRQAGSAATTSNYIVGGQNLNTTFAGTITNGGDLGGLNITKIGTGNWTLSGTSNFIGDMYVQQGTLTISGSFNNGGLNFESETGATLALAGGTVNTEVVQIDSGSTFTGYGAIDAELVNQGITTITGALTVNGNFENDGTLTVDGSGSMVINLPTDGSGSFVNNGLLDIMDSPSTALPAGYINNGTILTSALVTVKQFTKSGTTFSVSIQSYTGHTYQLEKSTNLGTWQNVGSAQAGATGSTLTLTDSAASATGTVYKIIVGP